MRIVVDMQGAQTASRFRGIGRYTMSFAQALARNAGQHDVVLALSGLFPETIEPIRSAFEGLLPRQNISCGTRRARCSNVTQGIVGVVVRVRSRVRRSWRA